MAPYLDQFLTHIQSNKRSQYLLLVGITFFALGLRLYKLGTWSFWIDEIFTINGAEFIWDWPPARMPFNLLFVHYALEWFGVSEWSARLTPAIIGTLSVPILFFPVKRLFGSGTAFITIILLAVAPWHLFWSQNARFYTLLLLFYNIGLLYTLIALEEERPLFYLIGGLFLLLALREKFTAVFFVPVLGIYILLLLILPYKKPSWLKWKILLLLTVPVILYTVYDTYSYFSRGYSQTLSLLSIFVGFPSDDPIRLALPILFNIGIPVVVLALFGGAYLLSKRNRVALFFLVSAVVPIIILLLINPFVFTKDRYVFATLPSWLILSAVAIKALYLQTKHHSSNLLVAGIFTLLLVDAMGANLLYFQVNNGNRRDWRQAFTLVQEKGDADDMVITWWPELGSYYLDHEITAWQDATPEMLLNSEKKVWFILDSETVWGNLRMKSWVEQNAVLINILYLRLREDNFSLHVYLYDPTTPEQ
jgi:uncharacterized membrane protein